MEFAEFQKNLDSAISQNEVITFFCNCKVVYSGRAEAMLPQGDRLIVIKADNTVQVHRPEGHVPVNYMKAGSSVKTTLKKDSLHLKVQNLNHKDFMQIHIYKIHAFQSQKLEDGQKLVLEGSEKDMSDMLYSTPKLLGDNFRAVSREEQTEYGFIDVLGHDGKGNLIVVECKRYIGGLKDVTQLRRYVEKLQAAKGTKKVKGILACPKITANAKKMLEDWGFKWIEVKPPRFLEKYDKSQTNLNNF
ncbi:DUF91 domain-containing protein [Candidatus Woesearchaeota archaeon]|nr:DUF91 domain-containing protein [Candidatus Woesearchaeota archaeon]